MQKRVIINRYYGRYKLKTDLINSQEYKDSVFGQLPLEEKLADPEVQDWVERYIKVSCDVKRAALERRFANLNSGHPFIGVMYRWRTHYVSQGQLDLTGLELEYLVLVDFVCRGKIVSKVEGLTRSIIAEITGRKTNIQALNKLVARGLITKAVLGKGGRKLTYYISDIGAAKVRGIRTAISSHMFRIEQVLLKQETKRMKSGDS